MSPVDHANAEELLGHIRKPKQIRIQNKMKCIETTLRYVISLKQFGNFP